MLLAQFMIQPATLAAWVVIGLAAAWLAGKMLEDATYGIIGEMLLGVGGAVMFGASYGFFVAGEPTVWISAIFALIGASIFVGIGRVLAAPHDA